MNISTVNNPDERREKLQKMKEFHRSTFEALGIPNALFIPKLAYKPSGKTERMIGLFASEIAKGQDIYIEFAESEGDPQDPERRLYKWRYNPNFREEYEFTEVKGTVRYFVPTSELILIKTNAPETLLEEHNSKSISTNVDASDEKISDATLRDLYAVLHKKPVSNKKWLNDLITSSHG